MSTNLWVNWVATLPPGKLTKMANDLIPAGPTKPKCHRCGKNLRWSKPSMLPVGVKGPASHDDTTEVLRHKSCHALAIWDHCEARRLIALREAHRLSQLFP